MLEKLLLEPPTHEEHAAGILHPLRSQSEGGTPFPNSFPLSLPRVRGGEEEDVKGLPQDEERRTCRSQCVNQVRCWSLLMLANQGFGSHAFAAQEQHLRVRCGEGGGVTEERGRTASSEPKEKVQSCISHIIYLGLSFIQNNQPTWFSSDRFVIYWETMPKLGLVDNKVALISLSQLKY